MDILLTPDEVATRLRRSRRTVISWLQQGKLAGIKIGNRWRVRERTLESILDEHTGAEDRDWLDGELGGQLPPYEWGPEGEPELQPVVVGSLGLMIADG